MVSGVSTGVAFVPHALSLWFGSFESVSHAVCGSLEQGSVLVERWATG